MISFKAFLLSEGGHATEKWNTVRATKEDVAAAVKFTSNVLGIPYAEMVDRLLGSTELTLMGKKKDSGDIDIAMPVSVAEFANAHEKMISAVNGEGVNNAGTKVASYAVPVNGKKVQVDLMMVTNKEWAKFIYHSSQGDKSKYPGAVRNIIMFTILTFIQEPGKDFVHRDDGGNVIARASRSIKLSTGMERLFKTVKINPKTGKASKALDSVSPDELESTLKAMGKVIEFDKSVDLINSPDAVAEFIFGKGVKAADIMTAEDVIKHAKRNPHYESMVPKIKSELERLKLPVPAEL